MSSIQIIEKIYELYKNKYKCMNDQLNEISEFCFECKNFICNNCNKIHPKTHKIIKLSNIEQKVASYKYLCNNVEEVSQKTTEEAIKKLEEIIQILKEIHKSLSITFEFRYTLLKKYNIKEKSKNEQLDYIYKYLNLNKNENNNNMIIDFYQ